MRLLRRLFAWLRGEHLTWYQRSLRVAHAEVDTHWDDRLREQVTKP